ncbi:MFS transporter, CP family, cyanate transporter [Oryzisolibacter propanilivorax]|uniref:MFS transporter, CP family, cyanate transporter n=1 Tax=Oryzisolibacter propanilivorax TaxID=1527607 RepID=A0A1G9P2E1_9BURK|nr:MFS transporter [Oryzisolibacter propanilivorax]SDL92844.1 MFS transporter, CP family, cyanate transporter [Oryzisolibacter propanilivorax]
MSGTALFARISRVPSSAWLVAAVLLLAANLRAPITGVAPLLDVLQTAFTLSPAQAGLLTSLPVLAFALLSPFAPACGKAWGLERTLLLGLVLVLLGLVLRATGGLAGLYLGTCLMGAGIALANVLLPSLIKRDFPDSVAAMTSAYSISMGLAAALASASVVGLDRTWGWQWALAAPLLLALPALVLWARVPRLPAPAAQAAAARQSAAAVFVPVWRSRLAWQVSLFMGFSSLLYYVLVTWLPSMLKAAGLSPQAAGQLHGVMQLATAIPGLLLAPVVPRLQDQRLLAAGVAALMGGCALGLWWLPQAALLWTFGFGLGLGGSMLLSLMFMGLRTGSPGQAAALSGMAQTLGYLLAAGGPILAGWVQAVWGGWAPVLAGMAALSVLIGWLGMQAGRGWTLAQDAAARHHL